MDLLSTLPINLSNEDYTHIYSELNDINQLVLNKYVELSTIKLLNHLKTNALNYNICVEFKHNTEHGFYYYTITCEDHLEKRDNNLEADLRKNLIIPSHYLEKLYKKDKKVEFINNNENRDKIIEFMIGENWQQWKKDAEIIAHHNSLLQKIPEKENNKESKKKI